MKTIILKLAAGQLVLGPLLAATIRDHKAAIVQAQRNELGPVEMMDLTATLATAAAQRVQPGLTLADIELLVDVENMGTVFSACWGITVPEPLPGEPTAVAANP